jgi:DNA-binding NtrC family response regulator
LRGRILVVDDDPEMCRLLYDVLTKEQHTVETAKNGQEALAVLSDQVDVVITDLQLPEMVGLELMHQAKQRAPDTAVIIITAFGTIESAIEAMKLGAYDYLPNRLSSPSCGGGSEGFRRRASPRWPGSGKRSQEVPVRQHRREE